MSCFKCLKCGERSYIFGEGGVQRTVEKMDMKLLGEIAKAGLNADEDHTFYSPMGVVGQGMGSNEIS